MTGPGSIAAGACFLGEAVRIEKAWSQLDAVLYSAERRTPATVAAAMTSDRTMKAIHAGA